MLLSLTLSFEGKLRERRSKDFFERLEDQAVVALTW
jgi:hypothetical protein